jgi:type 1 glutamine amidotransferase
VIFLSTTGDVLNDEQQAAFERYIKAGGGFVGIPRRGGHRVRLALVQQDGGAHVPHPSAGADRDHQGRGSQLPRHGPFPEAVSSWTEEWYEFDAARSKLHYLLSVDEKTYKPEANWGAKPGKGMGNFHPLAWYQEYDGGRAFYTALGHLPRRMATPTSCTTSTAASTGRRPAMVHGQLIGHAARPRSYCFRD